jgi:hypothetical protein
MKRYKIRDMVGHHPFTLVEDEKGDVVLYSDVQNLIEENKIWRKMSNNNFMIAQEWAKIAMRLKKC